MTKKNNRYYLIKTKHNRMHFSQNLILKINMEFFKNKAIHCKKNNYFLKASQIYL